jgi:predicted DsbA family dithiol-disulfide isomerase
MRVEIWSDIVCPWCYIGKRRFEAALARFPHADQVEVVWRSFELDPNAPRRREGNQIEHLARKCGMTIEQARATRDQLTQVAAEEGLEYQFDVAQPGNTLDAHRLLHLAAVRGVQDRMKERLLAAYFTEGAPIGDRDTLVRLAGEAGLDPTEAEATLTSDDYVAEIRSDEAEAAAFRISGVPFFVIDRKFGVSGAQPAEVLLEALERAWSDSQPLAVAVAAGGGSCDGDSCTV